MKSYPQDTTPAMVWCFILILVNFNIIVICFQTWSTLNLYKTNFIPIAVKLHSAISKFHSDNNLTSRPLQKIKLHSNKSPTHTKMTKRVFPPPPPKYNITPFFFQIISTENKTCEKYTIPCTKIFELVGKYVPKKSLIQTFFRAALLLLRFFLGLLSQLRKVT